MIVATVLRSGGEYTPLHVQYLQAAVRRYLHYSHRFVCLSDVQIDGVETIPLQLPPEITPGWWAKVELFRYGVFGEHNADSVLYFDLDTIICGDIEPMIFPAFAGPPAPGPLVMLRDSRIPDVAGSGIMWIPRPWRWTRIFTRYIADPVGCRARFEGLPMIGDQALIQEEAQGEIVFWQDFLPEGFLAPLYQLDADRPGNQVHVAYGSHHPKPWELHPRSYLAREWRGDL